MLATFILDLTCNPTHSNNPMLAHWHADLWYCLLLLVKPHCSYQSSKSNKDFSVLR